MLTQSEETRRLLQELQPGVHARPEGGPDSNILLILWAYHTPSVVPNWPLQFDPYYFEIVLG